jgi:hypothetical protein
VPLPDRALLDELDVGQKRYLICAEFARNQNAVRARARVVLGASPSFPFPCSSRRR